MPMTTRKRRTDMANVKWQLANGNGLCHWARWSTSAGLSESAVSHFGRKWATAMG